MTKSKKVHLRSEKDLEELAEGEWVFVEKSDIGFRIVMEKPYRKRGGMNDGKNKTRWQTQGFG
ncbi:hypothetical protein DRN72_04270 [Methanosarcinales archaeon]|nr:MAG: hypothetical protein DRN72_04270 [Methanosarcinales archaeon]